MRPEDMSKKKRKRRNFTDEYRAEIVRAPSSDGQSAIALASPHADPDVRDWRIRLFGSRVRRTK